jgi:hypothetical protein
MSKNVSSSKLNAPKLSDTQLIMLSEASQRSDGAIILPARLKGNSGTMAINALGRRGLIETDGDAQRDNREEGISHFRITETGLRAIGVEAAVNTIPGNRPVATEKTKSKKKTAGSQRAGSKVAKPKAPEVSKAPGKPTGLQHALVALLGRAKGATLDDLVKASGWQPHSVRGFLSGIVKTKLNLKLVRTKDPRRGSVYRIPD